jgi:uncharacterized protein (TIGR00251 family)
VAVIIRWRDHQLILPLTIQPGASQNKVVGLLGDTLKIQITAPANENKANQHLVKWLAKQFKVPMASVVIQSGQQSRRKIVSIKDPKKIPEWAQPWIMSQES